MTPLSELVGLASMASLAMLGTTRVRSMLPALALQGALLAAPLVLRGDIFLGCAVILVKAIAIPVFLRWSAVRLDVVRDRGVGLSPAAAMLVGAAIVVACHFQSAHYSAEGAPPGAAGLAVAMILNGLLIMVTRRLAISMLVGFLVLDNGIFTYAFTQTPGLPVVIELGVLFDLFLGVLLAGVVLFRVRSSFEHMDAYAMRELRE